jgi:hypothetical protein
MVFHEFKPHADVVAEGQKPSIGSLQLMDRLLENLQSGLVVEDLLLGPRAWCRSVQLLRLGRSFGPFLNKTLA